MPTRIVVRDESMNGGTLRESNLDFITERITVRELIRAHVYEEVQDHRRTRSPTVRDLIQPTDAERSLNCDRESRLTDVDWKQHYEKALRAFETGQILILLDDCQVTTLDQEIELRPGTRVSFLRLALLAGG
jgi:hypothetical protein